MYFLCDEEIQSIGFQNYGSGLLLSSKASIYGAKNISIGNNVRIDDFCILSSGEGGIVLGNNIHIACYTCLIGKAQINIGEFANISSRVAIYTSSDDYSGDYMTNPTIPSHLTNVDNRPVIIGKHSIIGSGSIVLPGVVIGEGCAIGAMSLVKCNCEPFGMYMGIPARRRGERSKGILKKENEFNKAK